MTTIAKPHAKTELTKFLQKRILALKPKKAQATIALEAGFTNVNVLAMIKTGSSKLPIDRVPGLAKALEVDPALLLRLALDQAYGDTAARALIDIFGPLVTANEMSWLTEIRDASDRLDPTLTVRSRSALRAIFGK